MFVGIDVHKHQHAAALIDERGGELAALTVPNSPQGYRRLVGWLSELDAADAVVGSSRRAAMAASSSGRLRGAAWRCCTCRPGAPTASAIAKGRARPTPATHWRSPTSFAASAQNWARRWSPSSCGRWQCSSCNAAASSATAPKRSSGCARTGPNSTPSAKRSVALQQPARATPAQADPLRRQPHRPDRSALHPRTGPRHRGPKPAHRRARHRDRRAARPARQPARRPPRRRHQPDRHDHRPSRRRPPLPRRRRLRALLRRRPDPLRLRHKPPAATASTAAATDNSTPRSTASRSSNNATTPTPKPSSPAKLAEGKTPQEARRALKRHLANVLYRHLHAWANTTPAMNPLLT